MEKITFCALQLLYKKSLFFYPLTPIFVLSHRRLEPVIMMHYFHLPLQQGPESHTVCGIHALLHVGFLHYWMTHKSVDKMGVPTGEVCDISARIRFVRRLVKIQQCDTLPQKIYCLPPCNFNFFQKR
ncbi:UNVERIFIED_CONTAM: hypothetical protein K2H54_039782 [Gekko kuhli]